MGPSMIDLKSVYERAQSVDKFDMRRQPKAVHTWNTSKASTYWDMRLRVACAATDAEFQNRLMARDRTSTSLSRSDSPTPIPTACRTLRNSSGLDPGRRLNEHGRWQHRTDEKKRTASTFAEFTPRAFTPQYCSLEITQGR